MANASLSFNTGLAALPETSNPELFQELVRVYNAIKIVAEKADIADGTFPDLSSTARLGKGNIIIPDLTAGEALSLGQMVALRGAFPSPESAPYKVFKTIGDSDDRFFAFVSSTEDVAEGDLVEVTVFGVYPYGGGNLTPGIGYRIAGTGQFTPITPQDPNPIVVGYAVTPDVLFFTAGINYDYYKA